MNIEIKINCPNPEEDLHIPYLTWGPSICHIRVRGNTGNKILYLRSRNLGMGRAVFTDAQRKTVYPITTLTCEDEAWTTFYLSGDFGNASTRDKDIEILVFQDDPNQNPDEEPIATEAVMVRVRKDVETLTEEEKTRFIRAFSILNQKDGYAFYKQFTDMHIANTDNEIHFYENFLPWHRLYLLNLERDLQEIDSSVSLHYWRWDFPAPNLFSENFAGKITITKTADAAVPIFSLSNPWRNWKPPGSAQLFRSAFNWDLTLNGGWNVLIARKAPEAYAINMGKGIYHDLYWDQYRERGKGSPGYIFSAPHGGGHMSFRGQISDIANAPQDPVFFMLHSNVDRLWALWQNNWDRFAPDEADSYSPQGLSPNRDEGFAAYSQQTQWPWNGDTNAPRPPQAPYGEYPTVKKGYKVVPKPTSEPTIEEVIDYKGRLAPNNSIGFDYDNVPFHFTATSLPLLKTMAGTQHIRQILNKSLDSQLRLAALASVDEPIGELDSLARIVTDKKEPAGVRAGVAQLLTRYLGHTIEFVRVLIRILTDLSEPAELRKTVILQIRALTLEGPAFKQFRPIVIDGLRKVIRDKDKQIALEAIDLLAYQKDEWLQRVLIEGLENADKAIVSDETAVYYLSLDPHNFLDLFRKVAEESSDEKAKIMAIHALSSDTSSADFLLSVFENKAESSEVREAAAHALDAQNPELLLAKSVEAFKDDEEQDHQLLTVLLSKLTLQDQDGLNKIRNDEELLNKIRQHAEQPLRFKANAESSEAGQDDFGILLNRLNTLL
ncbi:tyrosinase family protein [Flavobacterium poyangense]|uniref:tyrosinase family protein n=1 Tax=Flavobacterium poyangense TaxID=2204302 RepID=UPI00142187C8|nr:tyrosinase family protein [Flavobacterium sp. JXAS1]